MGEFRLCLVSEDKVEELLSVIHPMLLVKGLDVNSVAGYTVESVDGGILLTYQHHTFTELFNALDVRNTLVKHYKVLLS